MKTQLKNKKTILVIEDERPLLEVVNAKLEKEIKKLSIILTL